MKLIAIALLVLMFGGCVLTQRTTDADLQEWQDKLDQVKEFRIKAEEALVKAEQVAEKLGSQEASEAVAEAKEKLALADEAVKTVQEQLDNVEVGSPMWVNILTGVAGVVGTVLAARGVPNGGNLLLRLTETPANRRKIAKEVLAREKWVEEV